MSIGEHLMKTSQKGYPASELEAPRRSELSRPLHQGRGNNMGRADRQTGGKSIAICPAEEHSHGLRSELRDVSGSSRLGSHPSSSSSFPSWRCPRARCCASNLLHRACRPRSVRCVIPPLCCRCSFSHALLVSRHGPRSRDLSPQLHFHRPPSPH